MLSAIFLSSLVMANIIGVTKFFTVFGLRIPIGIATLPDYLSRNRSRL